MKRQREDPLSYLGGDLADITDNNGQLTKSQRNQLRKANNKKWKLTDRKVGSGRDPCPRHTLYYKAQLPELRDEDEWKSFQASLVDPLPVSFRIGGGCPAIVEQTFRKRMKDEFNKFSGHYVEVDGKVLTHDIVKPVPWAGSGVWQVSADSATLAKNPGFQVLSGYLRREVTLGNIVRQELASMIPALLLNVQSHHNVLDVCAAPGSKTEQLLHIMQASRPVGSAPSSGMVVANDADPVRINTLKNRYTRCLTPNLLITCATAEELCSRIHQPVFDRILADVPCSGDGTIRKFPHIWRLFRPRMSLDLHKVQLSIAKASVDMLKVGGRMVYSTCSINPLEDESVVSALLQHYWHQGLRLVDTRAEGLLPELKSRVGLSHWRCDPDVFVVGETDDAVRKESLNRLPEIVPTMLPPSPEDAVQLNLERCHRILPQDNDTGGFFVAVLELQDCTKLDADDLTYFSRKISHKKKKLAKESLTSVNVMKELGYNPKRKQAAPVSTMRTKKEQKSQKLKKEEPSTSTVIKSPDYNTLPEDELVHFTNALDLHNSFPTMNSSGKLAECEEVCSIRMVAATVEKGQEDGPMEELSLVSAGVQEALETWAQAEVGMLVHAGVPVATFSQYSPNLVSLIADGVPSLLPWMRGKSTAQLSSEDFKVLANLICEGGVTQLSVAEKESVTQKIMNSADDESMLKNCILTDKGQETLDRLCFSAQEQLKEVDGIQHLMLVLDPKSTTSSRQTSSVTIHNTVKKRLSKMERKRLEKQKQQQKLATNTNEKPNSTNDAGSSASAVNENASSLGEVAQHAKEATIVIQVRRGGRYRSDFIVSLLTKEDVCKSYAASITVL